MFKTMIADDEFWMLEGLKKVIKRDCPAFTVTAAVKDGAQAIEQLEKETFDLVITDIRMPKMDGLQLLQEMRRRGWDIPVLIVSAYSDFAYAKQAIHYGAFDYILKPINRGEIAAALERVREMLAAKGHQQEALLDSTPELPLQGKQVIESMQQHIHTQYMQDLSIMEFADKMGFNPSYLSRLFKQETGKGFVQYLTEYRLDIAIRMMQESGFNITEIARQVGYSDYKHFRKVFKQYTGMSPSEHLKQRSE